MKKKMKSFRLSCEAINVLLEHIEKKGGTLTAAVEHFLLRGRKKENKINKILREQRPEERE